MTNDDNQACEGQCSYCDAKYSTTPELARHIESKWAHFPERLRGALADVEQLKAELLRQIETSRAELYAEREAAHVIVNQLRERENEIERLTKALARTEAESCADKALVKRITRICPDCPAESTCERCDGAGVIPVDEEAETEIEKLRAALVELDEAWAAAPVNVTGPGGIRLVEAIHQCEVALQSSANADPRQTVTSVDPSREILDLRNEIEKCRTNESLRIDWAARCAVIKSDWLAVLKRCGIEPAFANSGADALAVERYIDGLRAAVAAKSGDG